MQKLYVKTPAKNKINYLFVNDIYTKFQFNSFIHIIPDSFMLKYHFLKIGENIEFRYNSSELMGYIHKLKVLCTAKIVDITPTQFDKIDLKFLGIIVVQRIQC